jgi:dihydroorotate dehydrogenase (fumarate)
MAEIKTTYMGLELKSPVIVGACGLTDNADKIKKIEAEGAGAVVFKSLFEEQINLESIELQEQLSAYDYRNAEMGTLFPKIEHAGPEEHLNRLRKAKESVNIPVIGSLNAVFKETWLEYAELIAETGIDALELNFYHIPKNVTKESSTIIEEQMELLYKIKNKIKIPVCVKLSPYYTNSLRVIDKMDKVGVNSFVMFNRQFQPDIDIDNEKLVQHYNLSNTDDFKLPLRITGWMYGKVKADLCGNTGIYTAKETVKLILAGAKAVEVVSTLYKNGIGQIGLINRDLKKWMDEKGYSKLDDFRGKLAMESVKDPFAYKRAQYVDILMRENEILGKHNLL